MSPQTGSSSSPSGGLACAVAALAERQQIVSESSMGSIDGNIPSFNMQQSASRFHNRVARDSVSYTPTDNIEEVSPSETVILNRCHGEWGMDHLPRGAELATSYSNSVAAEDVSRVSLPQPVEIHGNLESRADPIVPESFEEQMMLAMAVSLADARAMSSGPVSSWP